MSTLAFSSGDPRWATYKQAEDRGWQVRKGERGTIGFFFKKLELRDDSKPDDSEDSVRRIPLLRAFTLFHASQIDGVPDYLPPTIEEAPWRAPESAEIIVSNSGAVIRGKGKRHDRMPLPEDVGNAIVDYIRKGRRGTSRTLFVSSKLPYQPFADSQILNSALKEAFERTGLRPPQKYVGSHLLRHSLATDMLRKGASLDDIGDVLRHRFPRPRGDGPRIWPRREIKPMVPPPTRGWSDGLRRSGGLHEGSPAHAGMVPLLPSRFAVLTRFPRPRGDGPFTASSRYSVILVPPPTRLTCPGWTGPGQLRTSSQFYRTRDASVINRLPPSPAGVDPLGAGRGQAPSRAYEGCWLA